MDALKHAASLTPWEVCFEQESYKFRRLNTWKPCDIEGVDYAAAAAASATDKAKVFQADVFGTDAAAVHMSVD